MGKGSGASPHIAVFPWLAFGHLLPFLELAKALARRGHRISFLSTPHNLQRLRKGTSHHHLLHFVELPFPAGTPLPPGAEATSDIPLADNGHLKKAFDDLQCPFAAFLDSASPPVDWIVQDFASHWTGPLLAARRRIPCALFSVFAPGPMAYWGAPSEILGPAGDGNGWICRPEDVVVPPAWISGVSTSFAYYPHEAKAFAGLCGVNLTGVRDSYRFGTTIEAVQLVIIRSCPELDGDWIRLLGELYAKPVLPAGFLSPPAQKGAADAQVEAIAAHPRAEIFDWLDRQAAETVVYIAFGSEAVLDVALFPELAHGLHLSGVPFLWALRRPVGLPPETDLMPEGFEAMTAGKGLVAKGWVPQKEILAHPAVGGFLTHCGWSSIPEAMRLGLPLVLLPVFADQGLTSRMLQTRGWGKEVPRAAEDGLFTRKGVAETVRFVVADAAGETLRATARAAAAVFPADAVQESYVDGLARFLVENKDGLLSGVGQAS